MHIIDILCCILFYILNCILCILYILHIVNIEHIYLHIACVCSGLRPGLFTGHYISCVFWTYYAYYFTYLLTYWQYDFWERLQRPVECPITLARGVGPFRFGPTRSPVFRISAHRHPLKDGEGGPRAGLCRPGQTSRQPDAKSSATLAGPSLLRVEKESRTPVGKPRTASGRRWFDHVSPHSAARSSSARHMRGSLS
jgi:hypothetical protein